MSLVIFDLSNPGCVTIFLSEQLSTRVLDEGDEIQCQVLFASIINQISANAICPRYFDYFLLLGLM